MPGTCGTSMSFPLEPLGSRVRLWRKAIQGGAVHRDIGYLSYFRRALCDGDPGVFINEFREAACS